ncbi:helix-turn-helix transcriptional regulator [Amycolatopsis sp. H20-H5]|uniref:helix-turn-helix transcriptional regulator n=1 Tax=Amycolatopsis sp. H20-H5 TaxID=3046309 RepID=UPI002DB6B9DA|nr:AAA family ATPase [Amycolatopsis sp. H20-H5]MEC3978741.1 AAA family ATPase [Amycolatopsis sp. H20-H5]
MDSSELPGAASTSEIFVGRERELHLLHECAEGAAAGQLWFALLEGPPGVGKSWLVTRFTAALTEWTVWSARADPSEGDLRFGAVSQLVAHADRAWLGGVRTLESGPHPQTPPSTVGAQLLQLIGEAQEAGPVCLVLEDLPWADSASVEALGFLLRRLDADRVLVVVTARTEDYEGVDAGGGAWRRWLTALNRVTRLSLASFSVEDVLALGKHSGKTLSPAAASRIVAHTEGNPLYVHEVLAEVPESGLPFTAAVPLPRTMAEAVRGKLTKLQPDSRSLLGALAVLDARVALATAARVAAVPDAASALEPLLASGLVRWWPAEPVSPIEIRHRLQREAVYEAMGPVTRRKLHAAAVALADPNSAWLHRVAAADTVDAGLATELEVAATGLLDFGQAGRAATMLRWAADLSATRAEHERRLLDAAKVLAQNLSLVGRALTLEPAIAQCAPSALRTYLLGRLAMVKGDLVTSESLLSEAYEASRDQPGLTNIAGAVAGELLGLFTWQGRSREAIELGSTTLRIMPPSIQAIAKGNVAACVLFEEGPAAALRRFAELTSLGETGRKVERSQVDLLVHRSTTHLLSGSITAAIDDLTVVLQMSRDGALVNLETHAYQLLACAHYVLGSWDDSAVFADRAVVLAETTGAPWEYAPAYSAAAMIAAGRGNWHHAEQHAHASEQHFRTIGPPQFLVFPVLAAAMLAQARGDYVAMLLALQPVTLPVNVSGWTAAFEPWWLPLRAEALIGAERLDEAQTALGRMKEFATDVPYLRTGLAWLSGRLAEKSGDSVTALSCYQTGVAAPMPKDNSQLYLARLEQAYGRLLVRRPGTRRAGIGWLRSAQERFAAMGARPFLEISSKELSARGIQIDSQPTDPLSGLTDREREVVTLISRGFLYRSAAKELYVSVKTIEYHIGNAYAKLGVTNRSDLAKKLAAAEGAGPGGSPR